MLLHSSWFVLNSPSTSPFLLDADPLAAHPACSAPVFCHPLTALLLCVAILLKVLFAVIIDTVVMPIDCGAIDALNAGDTIMIRIYRRCFPTTTCVVDKLFVCHLSWMLWMLYFMSPSLLMNVSMIANQVCTCSSSRDRAAGVYLQQFVRLYGCMWYHSSVVSAGHTLVVSHSVPHWCCHVIWAVGGLLWSSGLEMNSFAHVWG